MPGRDQLGFTQEQVELLKRINTIGKQIEQLGNSGKVHAVVALLEELSGEYIDEFYIREKVSLLFPKWDE